MYTYLVTLLLTPRSPRYLVVPVASVTKVQGDPSRVGRSIKIEFYLNSNFGYFSENNLALNSLYQPSLMLGSGIVMWSG